MHAKLLATPRHLLRKERSRTDQPFLQHEKLRAGPLCRLINNFHRMLITQALVFSLWRCRLSIAGPLTKVDYQGGGWVWVCMQADISLHHLLSYFSSSFSFLAARTFLTIKATDQALGQRQPPLPPLPLHANSSTMTSVIKRRLRKIVGIDENAPPVVSVSDWISQNERGVLPAVSIRINSRPGVVLTQPGHRLCALALPFHRMAAEV
jgi:hypothetical protein